MVECFMLWGAAPGPGPAQLTFAASRMNYPCIDRGSATMIDEMLTDLGLPGQAHQAWSIRYFRTNHYAELTDPLAASDTWFDTWEITLDLPAPLDPGALPPRDPATIRRTYARDDTWTGAPPPAPAPHVLIAEFQNDRLHHRARAAVASIGSVGAVTDTELADLIEALRVHPLAGGVRTWRAGGPPGQLAVEVGVFDPAALSGEPERLLRDVSALLHEYAADTLWHNYSDSALRSR
jgi:hypothetical protein